MDRSKTDQDRMSQDEMNQGSTDQSTAQSRADQDKMEQEAAEQKGCCCAAETQVRLKERTEAERKALMRRLSIIEGQIRGIRGMLEKDIYCIDILTQVSAANCALNSFSRELLAGHMRSCVAEDIREGNSEKLDELLKVLPKLMK